MGKKRCVCFLQSVLYVQDKIHLGKEGMGCGGSNCNQATALLGDFHRFLAGLQQYNSSSNLADFTPCFCACFYFWLRLSSPLQLFQVPQEEAHSCRSPGTAQETVALEPPTALLQARTKSWSSTPSSNPGQTDPPRLW